MVLGVTLAIAFYYTGGIQDRLKINQINNFANKIISSAESVFSSGAPSRITIKVYLPDGVRNLTVIEDSLFIEIETSNGLSKVAFPSGVPITGTISSSPGIKKIEVVATINSVSINQI
jgi:hypothetical protein